MCAGLPQVFALDRRRVHDRGVAQFGAMRMVDEYVAVYERLVDAHRRARPGDRAALASEVRA
jgi:hypothetical protein